MSQKPTGRSPILSRLQAHRPDLARAKEAAPLVPIDPAADAAPEPQATNNSKLSAFERELFRAWSDD